MNDDNCELLYFKENSRLFKAFGVGACHRSELRKLMFSHCTLADNRAQVRSSSTYSHLLKWIDKFNDTISERDLETIVIAEERLIKLMSKNQATGKKATMFPKVAKLRVIVQHFLEMLHRCVPNSRMYNNAEIWQLEGTEYAGFLGVKIVHTCQLPKLLARHTAMGKKRGWCDPGYLESLKKDLTLDLGHELLNYDHEVRHISYYQVRCPPNTTAEEGYVLDNHVNGVEMQISKFAKAPFSQKHRSLHGVGVNTVRPYLYRRLLDTTVSSREPTNTERTTVTTTVSTATATATASPTSQPTNMANWSFTNNQGIQESHLGIRPPLRTWPGDPPGGRHPGLPQMFMPPFRDNLYRKRGSLGGLLGRPRLPRLTRGHPHQASASPPILQVTTAPGPMMSLLALTESMQPAQPHAGVRHPHHQSPLPPRPRPPFSLGRTVTARVPDDIPSGV